MIKAALHFPVVFGGAVFDGQTVVEDKRHKRVLAEWQDQNRRMEAVPVSHLMDMVAVGVPAAELRRNFVLDVKGV